MRRRYGAVVAAVALLLPGAAAGLGPEPDPRRATYLEYSRNLVAAYPAALARRIRQLRQQAGAELSDPELCRRAVARVPEDLETNSNRRVVLVGAGPVGRAADAWERQALATMATAGEREHHAFVKMELEAGGPAREVFRYLGLLDRLPAPCDGQAGAAPAGPAVSILRLGAAAGGGARLPAPERDGPPLRLPHPSRQGQRR